MAPLIVMLVIWVAIRVIGFAGWWAQANSSRWALRVALAGMFLFTAVSHFHPRTRPDLVQMVPPGLPAPELLVTVTGLLEMGGAAGCLFRRSLAQRHSASSDSWPRCFPQTSTPHSRALSLPEVRRRRWSGVCHCSCSGCGRCGGQLEGCERRR